MLEGAIAMKSILNTLAEARLDIMCNKYFALVDKKTEEK